MKRHLLLKTVHTNRKPVSLDCMAQKQGRNTLINQDVHDTQKLHLALRTGAWSRRCPGKAKPLEGSRTGSEGRRRWRQGSQRSQERPEEFQRG